MMLGVVGVGLIAAVLGRRWSPIAAMMLGVMFGLLLGLLGSLLLRRSRD